MRLPRPLFFALFALAGAGCKSTTEPAQPVEPGIRTDGDVFEMTSYPSPWPDQPAYQVEISYTFTNRTGGPVYIVNCGGDFDLRLERKVEDEWVAAWIHLPNTCLSDAIVVERSAVYSTTMNFWGWVPGEISTSPEFDARPGTYRILWNSAVSYFHFDLPTVVGDPIPLEDRLSNEFELVFAEGAGS